ncbi:hypothetical protein C5167_005810 [Papaver somniferum]|uniref:MORF/ORRM1/DAG-like MORF domain-containing protein n=1 Tax=Papaver somniferum TaxID=3469 RepID=A0A4Y7JF16_PAPSO|nr:hypothetical protein C5167_005810 [Papaver somniferum]
MDGIGSLRLYRRYFLGGEKHHLSVHNNHLTKSLNHMPGLVAVSHVPSLRCCSIHGHRECGNEWVWMYERNAGFEVMSSVLNLQWTEKMMSLCEKWIGAAGVIEKKAQMCIYNASWETHFGFCCDIDKAASHELSGLPEVLFVRPDRDFESAEKDYSLENVQLGGVWNLSAGTSRLFSEGNSKNWLVRMEKATVEVVTKAQMVDYYTQILSSEMDAQMCIYHISWKNFGFCCEIDDEYACELVEGDFEVVAALSYLRSKVRKLQEIGCACIEWLAKNKSAPGGHMLFVLSVLDKGHPREPTANRTPLLVKGVPSSSLI